MIACQFIQDLKLDITYPESSLNWDNQQQQRNLEVNDQVRQKWKRVSVEP